MSTEKIFNDWLESKRLEGMPSEWTNSLAEGHGAAWQFTVELAYEAFRLGLESKTTGVGETN